MAVGLYQPSASEVADAASEPLEISKECGSGERANVSYQGCPGQT